MTFVILAHFHSRDFGIMKDEKEYEVCIKCHEPVRDKGQTCFGDGTGDGFQVSACDNPYCERYGVLVTVTA